MLKNTKVILCSAGMLAVTAIALPHFNTSNSVHAENTTFQVNVKESLSVSVTTPSAQATGNENEFLRNTVSLDVSTNNANGFTASMYSLTSTNLTNTAKNTENIPTLASSSTRSSFPANYWGYSLRDGSYNSKTYGETDAGNTSSYYHPLVSTSANPITVLTGTSTGNQNIYFGAKANRNKAAGTYAGTVIISVVTDVIDNNNPITPSNPATPNTTENVAVYTAAPTGGSNGSTTYTYSSSNAVAATNTTTTQVSDGNNVSAYSGYTPPQGVVDETIANIPDGSKLATGLAVTSAVAAVSGLLFFIVAKRRDEDDDEEENEINY